MILLCMWASINGDYFEIGGSLKIRTTSGLAQSMLKSDASPVAQPVKALEMDFDQRLDMVLRAFDSVEARSKDGAHIILIGAAETKRGAARRRNVFNAACSRYCETRPKFRFVDVNSVIPDEAKVDPTHYSPAGYFMLAKHIFAAVEEVPPEWRVRADARKPLEQAEVD
jgi:hypothetical protein